MLASLTGSEVRVDQDKWLKIKKIGDGQGKVTSQPAGIDCGWDCEADFEQGERVRLTALLASGSVFGGWHGDCNGTNPTFEVRLNGNRSCTAAFFSDEPKTLRVVRSGNGSGHVTSSPSGIDCGSDCTQDFPSGTTVQLTATPHAGSEFIAWRGDCADDSDDDDKDGDDQNDDPVLSLILQQDQTCIAQFGQTQLKLTVTKTGDGAGRVTSNPGGIDCGSDCKEDYALNTIVQLTATPAAGSIFERWSGDCSGTNQKVSVTLTRDKTCTAKFDSFEPELKVTKTGDGAGRVTSNRAGIDCVSDCKEDHPLNTIVQLTATPVAGSTFEGWSGDCTGANQTVSVTLSRDKTCTANFDSFEPELKVTKIGDGAGRVTSNPAGIDCGNDCHEDYPLNTIVQLTATPAAGSTFDRWSGDCTGTNQTVSVTLSRDKTCTATFDSSQPKLTVTKIGVGAGRVTSTPAGIDCGSDCEEEYPSNTIVQLTATPAEGSTFEGWSGDCTGTNETTSVTLSRDKTCTADFDSSDPADCVAELRLEHVTGSCSDDIEVGLNLRNTGCVLRGLQLTIDDDPERLDLISCELAAAQQGTFSCSVNDDGDQARVLIVSTSGGLIPAGSSRELARLTFQGNDRCDDDCTTDVDLRLTDVHVADAANDPVDVVLYDGAFSTCPGSCSLEGEVDCSGANCTLFDVVATVDQALHGSGTCEADVAGCDSQVNLFDVVCLIDCALDRPSHCLLEPCNGSSLPSGCGDQGLASAVERGNATLSVDFERVPGGESTVDVRLEDADSDVLGMALTFRLPAAWEVIDVIVVGAPASFEAPFHQSGATLKVLLLSNLGELLPASGGDAGVHVVLQPRGMRTRGMRVAPVLTAAEVADAEGSSMNVTLTHE